MPTLQANHTTLYYECDGQGPPLLLLHGLGSSTRDWEHQVTEFARSHTVITIDLRGHGRSAKPAGPYSLALFAADIADCLRVLGLEPVHVVGLSLGGCIAFQLAVDFPQQVKTLTIVNSVPDVVIRSWAERLMFWERLALVHLFGMRHVGKTLSRRLFVKPEQHHLRQTFVARWADNDRRTYGAALRAMIGWSVLDRLETIRCPTLVVTADQDYTPVSRKAAYVAKLPQAQLVTIADSHHLLPIERPGPFNEALRTFLDQHRQPGNPACATSREKTANRGNLGTGLKTVI